MVSIERVPLEPEVLTKPLPVRLESAGMEAELLIVRVERLPVVEKRLVDEAVVAKKLVVVAEVVVELRAVKFWRVVEAVVCKAPVESILNNSVPAALLKVRNLPSKEVVEEAEIKFPVVPVALT